MKSLTCFINSKYEKKADFVLDFHLALRTLLRGDWKNSLSIYRAIGFQKFFTAAFYWLVTLNNRLRPKAPFLIPEDDRVAIQTLADKASHSS